MQTLDSNPLSTQLHHSSLRSDIHDGENQAQREKRNPIRATSSPTSNVARAELQIPTSSPLPTARIPKHGPIFLPLQHRLSAHKRGSRSRESHPRLMV
jgi:hypothetical protein